MATFNVWRGETTLSISGYFFIPSMSFSSVDDDVLVAYATTGNYNNGKAPWNTTLYLTTLDFFGGTVVPARVMASYTVPGKSSTTSPSFAYHYDALVLSTSQAGLLWTTSANPTYAPAYQTVVNFQPLTLTGSASAGPAIQLKMDGTATAVTNLNDIGFADNADFGKGLMVVYSTYDPGTSAVQIKYEHFTLAGQPLNGGVLASINDGSAHGVDFRTYVPADDPYNAAAYLVDYRLPVGQTSAIHSILLSPDGQTTLGTFDILLNGPNGEASSGVQSYGFSGLSKTDAKQQYGIFEQTYYYTDANSKVHEQVGIELVSAIGTTSATISARTQFEDVGGTSGGVAIARVLDGDFVIAYSDGGQTYLREYDSGLRQIGATFAVPDDNYGYTNLVSLGDGRVMLEWRQSSGSTYMLHNAIYDTRQSGMTITPAVGTPAVAGTVFDDTVNQVAGTETINGGGGSDTFAVTSGIGAVTTTVDVAGQITVVSTNGNDTLQLFTTVQYTNATLAIEAGTTTSGTNSITTSAFALGHVGTTITTRSNIAYAGMFTQSAGTTLALTGGYLLLTGSTNFAGGSVAGTQRLYAEGTTTIASLTIGGTTVFQDTKTVTQAGGTVTVGDTSASAAVLLNSSTATYSIADDSGIARGTAAGSTVLNQGLFQKTGGTATSTVTASFVDTGTVTVKSGTLALTGPSNSVAGAITGAGTIQFGAGSTTIKAGTTATVASLSLAGAGTKLLLTANLTYAGTFSQGAGAILNIGSGNTLTLAGTSSLGGPVAGAGTLAVGGGTTTLASGAALSVATLTVAGSGTILKTATSLGYAGTFSQGAGSTLSLSGGYLQLTGSTSLTGATITGSQRFYAQGATTIAGLTIGGTVIFQDTKTVTQAGGTVTVGDSSASAAILFNTATASYAITDNSGIARGASAGSYILNQGSLVKTGGTGTSTIGLNIVNNVSTAGTVAVTSGTLELGGTVSGAMRLQAGAGSTLILDKAVAAAGAAAYTGTGATLQLSDAQDFHGTIAGFGSGQTLDLRSIAFNGTSASPSYTGSSTSGTLSVGDGTHTASLAMLGSFTKASFHAASDTKGGTVITFV